MKITSPIFLQQAGRAGKTPFAGIKVLFPYANPIIGSVSGNDDITVTSIKNGEKISNTYFNPDELAVSVQADANTWVIITGEITSFDCNNYYVSKLTAANNTALTSLDCSNCPGLTALDLSTNTALTYLDCSNCADVAIISYEAENEDVTNSLTQLITANEVLDGTVYTDSAGTYYSTIADAATAAGWTIAQL